MEQQSLCTNDCLENVVKAYSNMVYRLAFSQTRNKSDADDSNRYFIVTVYELMYLVSPTVAQFFMPVQKSCENKGIKMEVVSAYIHNNTAEIYITMQDLIGERVDETTDLNDSYSINRPFRQFCNLSACWL